MTTPSLTPRSWVPTESEDFIQAIAEATAAVPAADNQLRIEELVALGDQIHDVECVNLNPATNTMNPRAAAVLSAGIGARPSLGYPGAKYEMGLEAIEQIEVIAAELAAEVFNAKYAEVRIPSGAIGNLYAFMACAKPGDSVIVPPATIAGHVTHHNAGAAGLYGLEIHEAPVDSNNYTVDLGGLAALASKVQPKVISIGGSLNLTHHDVAGVRSVADSVGAKVLFDGAHLSGVIAGGAWPNPLDQGAHIISMSTYKSLAGPTAGLLVTNDAEIAERVDAIAYPGLTANFDASKTAALAITMADWLAHGSEYANTMVAAAQILAAELEGRGVPMYKAGGVATLSHAFAIDARGSGGGHATALHLRKANILTSAIGLPTGPNDGLRVGTNELVRWGAKPSDMTQLADLIAEALQSDEPTDVAAKVTLFRSKFQTLSYLVK